MKKSAIALVLGLSAFGAAPAMAAPAEGAAPDVIFYNGKIVTLNPTQASVDAVAVKDEKFMRVGNADVIRGLAGASTKLIDLGGRLTVPGLIDAHTHPMETIMMKEG